MEVEDTINNRVDLMFLHASPLVFKDYNFMTKKEGFSVLPQLDF